MKHIKTLLLFTLMLISGFTAIAASTDSYHAPQQISYLS
jgi:hypothetical protein